MISSMDSPIHTQLYNSLKNWFTDGFTPSDQLPTEQDIMKRFSVGRGTVRVALNELVRDGIIIRTAGKGSFLDPDYRVRLKRYSVAILLSEREFSGSDSWEYSWHNHMEMLNGVMKEALLKNISLEIIPEGAIGPELNRAYDAFISFRYIRAEKLALITRPVIPFHYELDLAGGLAGVVRDLAGCGYRNPAYIGTARAGRITLINAFLEMNGLSPLFAELVIECSGTSRDGYEACSALLETGERPDSIICSTDMRALGVLGCLKDRNIEVPGEMGVYGFDGMRESGTCSPTLTTWAFPWQELGTRAVCELRSLLDGVEISPYKVLKGALVSRESTSLPSEGPAEGRAGIYNPAGYDLSGQEAEAPGRKAVDRRIVHLSSFDLDFFLGIGNPDAGSPGTGGGTAGAGDMYRSGGGSFTAASPGNRTSVIEDALRRADRHSGIKTFTEFSLSSDRNNMLPEALPLREWTAELPVFRARSLREVWEGTVMTEALDYPLPSLRLSAPDRSSLPGKVAEILSLWDEKESDTQRAGLFCFREGGLFRVCLIFYRNPNPSADSGLPSDLESPVRGAAAAGCLFRSAPPGEGEDLEAWTTEYYRKRRPGGMFKDKKIEEILLLLGRE